MKKLTSLALLMAVISTASHGQSVIADWTFESSQPATAGLFTPEIGSGTASGFHVGAATYSSPAGNGSPRSFSSNTWAVGDYYQFQVSTTGTSGISVSFDQTSSNTGPGDFSLLFSTNGTNFTQFGSTYSVLANASPNPVWNGTTSSSLYSSSYDLSSITALNNASNVYFRLVDASAISANGLTVATTGTDRVDNFVVTGVAIPEPSTYAAILGGLVLVTVALRRRQSV